MSENDSDKDNQDVDADSLPPATDAVPTPVFSLFADEALDAKLAAAAKKDQDPEKIAQYKKLGAIGAAILLILLLVYSVYSCQPKQGSMAYGVCSTLLEMQTQYPNTLRHINVEGSRTAVRIYYTSIDAFGQYKLEIFECKFGPGGDGGMQISDIIHNRQSVSRKAVDEANKILPIIVNNDPYRVMPPEWKNQLLNE